MTEGFFVHMMWIPEADCWKYGAKVCTLKPQEGENYIQYSLEGEAISSTRVEDVIKFVLEHIPKGYYIETRQKENSIRTFTYDPKDDKAKAVIDSWQTHKGNTYVFKKP